MMVELNITSETTNAAESLKKSRILTDADVLQMGQSLVQHDVGPAEPQRVCE